MTRYYGIGKEGYYKYEFSIFLGNKMLCIFIHPNIYKFKPWLTYYKNCAWEEQTNFTIRWFWGFYITNEL